jgi:hypothetical protein
LIILNKTNKMGLCGNSTQRARLVKILPFSEPFTSALIYNGKNVASNRDKKRKKIYFDSG